MAKRSGITQHELVLKAIAEQAELSADFDTVAEERYACMADSGKAISCNEMCGCLEQCLAAEIRSQPCAESVLSPAARPRTRFGRLCSISHPLQASVTVRGTGRAPVRY